MESVAPIQIGSFSSWPLMVGIPFGDDAKHARLESGFPMVFPWFILLLPSFPMLFDPFVDAFFPSDRQGGVATSGDRLVLGWAAEQHLLRGFNWSLAMAIMGRSCETHAKISGEWQCSWENSWGTCLFFVGNHGNTHSTTAIDVKNLEKKYGDKKYGDKIA